MIAKHPLWSLRPFDPDQNHPMVVSYLRPGFSGVGTPDNVASDGTRLPGFSGRHRFDQLRRRYVAKKMLVLCATLACVAAAPAEAQVQVDVAKITCEQYLLFKVADPRDIAIWLSGYYHGKAGTTVVEIQQFKDKSEEVKTYCRQHLQQPVIEAVDKVVKESK
jgi:acid stress chaperone HdeB